MSDPVPLSAEQVADRPWWLRMTDTADAGQLPDKLADTPRSRVDTVWRMLLTEYVSELAVALNDQVILTERYAAELETLRGIAKRMRDGWYPDRRFERWQSGAFVVEQEEPMSEAEIQAIYGKEQSDGG